MGSTKVFTRLWLIACAAVVMLGLAGLWRLCARNPGIAYLPRHGPAEWVVYAWPYNPVAQHVVELNSVFRKSFVLDQPSAQATLAVRALRRMAVAINGTNLTLAAAATNANWKDAAEFQVANLLHPGTNEISITAFNDHGPPALWLSLDAGAVKMKTGPDWEASLEGAAWRHVRLAREPLTIEKGNGLYGGESTLASLQKVWPTLLVFAALSAIILYGGQFFLKKTSGAGRAASPAELAVLVVGIFWIALFINNRSTLPKSLGFDVTGHLAYVDFIKTHHALPLATDGWEMCQPPLYYMISASVLWVLQQSAFSESGIETLRFLGLFAGIIQLRLIGQCLRLLFPNDPGRQIFGIVLAGCLPAQLYIAQYVTNESMVALWATGAIYFCLRLIMEDKASWRFALGTGICLGAALLTKATALLAFPFVGGALFGWLCWKHLRERQVWLQTLGVVILTTFIVSGWHYLRVWRHFGTPLVHDWDQVSGFAWWADEGFQTGSYYGRFGESLIHPFQCVIHSFGDGIYSTLWGDGLYGSSVLFDHRPPWNYDLMAAGYILALLPTAIVLLGAIAAIGKFLRQPDPASFVIVGIPCATFVALVYLNLKLPFYCGVKAFYGLLALLPVCALGGIGWEMATRRARALAPLLYGALGVWALCSGAAFWIRGGTAATHTARGMHYLTEGNRAQAARQFAEALQIDPQYQIARRVIAVELLAQNRPADAETNIMVALNSAPDDAQNQLQLARILAVRGNLEAAIDDARAAVQSAPDFAEARRQLANWLFQSKRFAEAAEAGREALRLEPMNATLQFQVGSALAAVSNHLEAASHLGYACDLGTNWAEAHDNLGVSLLALNQREAAIRQFKEAVKLKPADDTFRAHLAAAVEKSAETP